MVHADASNFDDDVTKVEAYEQVLMQAAGLCTEQRNWGHIVQVSNGSNVDAGFYVLDPSSTKPQLILGPFQGKVACQTIAFGRGVCGAAAASQQTQLVADVDKFPGHIACDSDSKSEIVVPILVEKDGERKVVAIIDVDCTVENGFDELDKEYLEKLASLLGENCDW
ncbi:hypothetical protein E4U16_006486 [Claviceps sp. LM84 group G4]|nr:hypothetical protein E4U33_008065 [Claviceps sp. LM78 group G4]KAG6070954.1 hypothetical protein E4U16_006486 [Claviceps sp. LM84 group G4]